MKIKHKKCSIIALLLGFCFIFTLFPKGIISYASNTKTGDTSPLPSEYCMRDEYIVYAQTQDTLGYCWNFAATMAASTTIMKATGEYYDFSEIWTGIGLNVTGTEQAKIGSGGSMSHQVTAMNKVGLMLETDLPYSNSYTISDENAEDYYNFFEKHSNSNLADCLVSNKETSFSKTDIEGIKNHIYNHGSIYLTFTFRTGFIEENGIFALEPNQKNINSNHAVSVIGWDDNYQREYYLDGSTTPTVFKGAWIILNSYTENNGRDGISMVFYEDNNIGSVQGYKYQPKREKEIYFYDKIESGYSYPTNVKGKYCGDFEAKEGLTKQKNIFYKDVNLEYSYVASKNTTVKDVEIYLDGQKVTKSFNVTIDNANKSFNISKNNAEYGQYKLLVHYGNGIKSDTYLNNFFVTHGLVGEEIEFDTDNNDIAFNTGRDLEYFSFASSNKNYVIYTNKQSGEIAFLHKNQSVYSEKDMSLPTVSYEITNGESVTSTYTIQANSGYNLDYKFNFEYCEDTTMQPVCVYYDLGGGVNNSKNYAKELASPTKELVLYAPTRPGYTFKGWYLDYGNGSKKVAERDGVYYVSWDDIHHMGENPGVDKLYYYKNHYNNSNTLFVYAHWEEDSYYNVNLTVIGEGSSTTNQSILISEEDSIRYLLNPAKNWCLARLEINGELLTSNQMVEVIKQGLILKNIDQDISIVATFEEGIYLSLKMGENVKTAYIIGTSDNETQRFYNGDVIPKKFFNDRMPSIKLDGVRNANNFISEKSEEQLIFTPITLIPPFGAEFTLVVEIADDIPGYTHILENVSTYTLVEKGIFQKSYVISSRSAISEIDVGSAKKTAVAPVEIKYSVGRNVENHYISADKNATSGEQFLATYNLGEVVYLFVKPAPSTDRFQFCLPSGFKSIGNGWYRLAIYVNSEESNLGTISATAELQNYSVNVICGPNGSVDKAGETIVKYGSFLTLNITPNERFIIDYIKVDGAFVEVSNSLTIYKITKNTLVEIAFKQVVFDIAVSGTKGGKIAPSVSANLGESFSFEFLPDFWYKIKDVKIDGVSEGAVSNYSFAEITADHTVFVEYELNLVRIIWFSFLACSVVALSVILPIFAKKRNKI